MPLISWTLKRTLYYSGNEATRVPLRMYCEHARRLSAWATDNASLSARNRMASAMPNSIHCHLALALSPCVDARLNAESIQRLTVALVSKRAEQKT